MSLGWFDPQSFRVEEFEALYERPEHDICRISPKYVAFATPRDKVGARGPVAEPARPPACHLAPFAHLGVSDVVRLCEAVRYEDAVFVRRGLRHHVLEFPDCTAPSAGTVERFLDICDAAGGAVAVHCLAGLGRTGTLIACDMIKNHGFTAAEAIGYLRLMRPGSVIADQQHFLEDIEAAQWAGNRPIFDRFASTGLPRSAGEEGRSMEDAVRALTMGNDVANGSATRMATRGASSRHTSKDVLG